MAKRKGMKLAGNIGSGGGKRAIVREAERTNTNHSTGYPPAPRNDASGFKRGARGDEGPQFGSSKRTDLDAPTTSSSSGSTSANGTKSDGRAGNGGSSGRGGMASHQNMGHMHDDTPMWRGKRW